MKWVEVSIQNHWSLIFNLNHLSFQSRSKFRFVRLIQIHQGTHSKDNTQDGIVRFDRWWISYQVKPFRLCFPILHYQSCWNLRHWFVNIGMMSSVMWTISPSRNSTTGSSTMIRTPSTSASRVLRRSFRVCHQCSPMTGISSLRTPGLRNVSPTCWTLSHLIPDLQTSESRARPWKTCTDTEGKNCTIVESCYYIIHHQLVT